MNPKVRRAALRILLLTEEFSADELAEAIALVGGQDGEDLPTFLKRISSMPRRASSPRAGESGISTQGETRALQELKSVDDEKYRVLREFEMAIREGKFLKTLDEFRMFAKNLGKDFAAGKSRKEALGRLISLLAQMDLASIRVAIAKVAARNGTGENSFRRLANQIISSPPDPLPDKRQKGPQ